MSKAMPDNSDLCQLHKAVFLLDKSVEDSLESALGTSFSEFLVLRAIDAHPGISQLGVARNLDLTQAAVSKQLKLTVAKGFASRQEDPKNRRQRMLAVSPSGKKILSRSILILDGKAEEFFGILKREEMEKLRNALTKLIVAIKACG